MDEIAPLCVQKDIHAPEIEFHFNIKNSGDGTSETKTLMMKKEAAQDFFEQLELL